MSENTHVLTPRKRPGPKKRPISMLVQRESQPLSLRSEQFRRLYKLAQVLGVRSPTGPHAGMASWRTLNAALADLTPQVLDALALDPVAQPDLLDGQPATIIPLAPGVDLVIRSQQRIPEDAMPIDPTDLLQTDAPETVADSMEPAISGEED